LILVLAGLGEKDVLFLDEVHALPGHVREALYEAMTEGQVRLPFHQGAETRWIRITLPAFTLLAATTEGGRLEPAFRSRFHLRQRLERYGEDDLAMLVRARAVAEGFVLEDAAASLLASYARGTPREALNLLACVLLSARGAGECGTIDRAEAARGLAALGYVDGLTRDEWRYLAVLHANPGPVPLHRLMQELDLSEAEVKREIEPSLFRRGLVRMTPAGRVFAGGRAEARGEFRRAQGL
jgi:Holliday junction DNA helicase RuvB